MLEAVECGWTDGRIKELMDGEADKRRGMSSLVGGGMNGWMEVGRPTEEYMDGWTN